MDLIKQPFVIRIKSLRPNDAYIRLQTNHHWFRQWPVAFPTPSHYLNQCWNIGNWTLRNKLQWNTNQNSCIFIQENAYENVMSSGKWWSSCLDLNALRPSHSGTGLNCVSMDETSPKTRWPVLMALCSLLTPYDDTDLGQFWPMWWLVVWRYKSLPEPMLTYHQWVLVVIT